MCTIEGNALIYADDDEVERDALDEISRCARRARDGEAKFAGDTGTHRNEIRPSATIKTRG